MRFLHIADVHLGCTRYQLPESPRDFFDAWIDVLQKYALGKSGSKSDGFSRSDGSPEGVSLSPVDFVIMCGDFFHKRNVPPETMNYAVAGLQLLMDNGIPVVAIEGNHDQKYNDSEYSWLRSLANWNLVNLLEPSNVEGKIVYKPLADGRGGFIDIGRVRIFGSHWYGAAANWAIPMLTEAIKETRREGAFHLLMLHTDVEGHQTHPIPALSLSALKELKSVTDYVALGHTHMHYEIDNWAFNPGSIEVTNISEFRETRGAFVVEIDEDNSVNARHVTEYRHRPFQRLKQDVTQFSETKEITEAVLNLVSSSARSAVESDPAPIIEITLTGQLGFPNSLLEVKKMRDETQNMTGALHVRIKNHAAPIEYAVAADVEEDIGREKLERRVVEDLVTRDKRFKSNVSGISQAVIGAKQQALLGEEPEKIAEFIGQLAVK